MKYLNFFTLANKPVAAVTSSLLVLLFISQFSLAVDTAKPATLAKPGTPAKPANAPAAPAEAKPAVAKPIAPTPEAMAALAKASAELVKEFTTELKKPEPKLRDKCDYFGATPPAELTQEALIATLEKPQNSDPKIDAYVRWQLLSCYPKPFSPEYIPKAIAAYRKFPEPLDHPGLDRGKLDKAILKMGIGKKDLAEPLTSQVKEAAEKIKTANKWCILLRNDFFLRLPVTPETITAGLDDITMRITHGDIEDAGGLLDHIVKTVQTWEKTATNAQCFSLIQPFTNLKAKSLEPKYQPYVLCEFNAQATQLFWRGLQVNEKTFIDVLDLLKAAAKRPPPKKP